MDYRQRNIQDQLDRNGIVIASLQVADRIINSKGKNGTDNYFNKISDHQD